MLPECERKINEIHDAIIGNAATGNKGLLFRMEGAESKLVSHEKKFDRLVGAFYILGALGTLVEIIHFISHT